MSEHLEDLARIAPAWDFEAPDKCPHTVTAIAIVLGILGWIGIGWAAFALIAWLS